MNLIFKYCSVIGFVFFSTISFVLSDNTVSTPDILLKDPVFHGAWLYKVHCNRCHGGYQKERVGNLYRAKSQLKKAIEDQECEITWATRLGGELNNTEIESIVSFIRKFEKLDTMPEIPNLPPIPETGIYTPDKNMDVKQTSPERIPADPVKLGPALQALIDTNQVAYGGFLYTQNCYRCHLGYAKARMGMGVEKETLSLTISRGKTSTQMKPFSRMLGGDLKNNEIKAIVNYITFWEKYKEPPAIYATLLIPPKSDPNNLLPIGLPFFPIVSGDKTKGRKLFVQHCVRCHGINGQGYTAPSLNKHWWSLRPDLLIKSTLKQGIFKSPMPIWFQDNGGQFSAKEIRDTTSYVQSLSVSLQSVCGKERLLYSLGLTAKKNRRLKQIRFVKYPG